MIFPSYVLPADSQVCPSPTAATSCRPLSRCRSSSVRETRSTNSSASFSLTGCSRSVIPINSYTESDPCVMWLHMSESTVLSYISLHRTIRCPIFFGFFLLFSGLSLQEKPSVERSQSGYPPSCSRSGVGCAPRH